MRVGIQKNFKTYYSVRMYLSIVKINDINTKYNRNPKQESLNLYEIYNARWNIEF